MEIKQILSYLGGYHNSTKFELDIPRIADVAELTEEEVVTDLNELQSKKEIKLEDNMVTLLNIMSKSNKKFNDLYAPVETMEWGKGMKLKLDK